MADRLRLGTRGSALALAQAELVAQALRARGISVEVVTVRTTGDRDRSAGALRRGSGIFVKELEQALLGGRIDLAVHSAKDLPTAETDGVSVAAYLPRSDPRDALISRSGREVADLPPGARVGTDSPRRAAFLLALRPDLRIIGLRGNVDTRLRRLDAGSLDAIVVAAAGLQRLGLARRITAPLSPQVMLPAVGQGAVAVQVRVDGSSSALVASLDHLPTRQELVAERAFLRAVGGGCRAPIAALARVDGGRLVLEGAVVSPDGRSMVRDRAEGAVEMAEELGSALGARLLARGAAVLAGGGRT
ncbi:MAG: hydroxymethylbilane synthase [Armatimonadota bacterium]|nr:hydroxymethylbilane synthase [Armatimonadota bacterium]MDR7427345.1 hydroxymethylbilane synthase [Armatimonadota bacterium]MDR7464702.1 hydroxymethylbilane synthase [Armatimonadota bacterium]MDR7468691.1 hydroxymethylbilane synthase [Armatimonadota bacterium]MDR7474370.1 hydroxymethylbilane synthase [Armatimonadota bacterium]